MNARLDTVWLFIQISQDLKNYLPKTMAPDVLDYMCTNLFLDQNMIPIWDPSPSVDTGPQAWKRHNGLGDVGYFNDRGGFSTLFNIFETVERNADMWAYSPPEGFSPCLVPMEQIFGDPSGDRIDPHFDHEIMFTSGFATQKGSDIAVSLKWLRLI